MEGTGQKLSFQPVFFKWEIGNSVAKKSFFLEIVAFKIKTINWFSFGRQVEKNGF